MFGARIGTLHIKQRKQTVDGQADILLWTVSGHQGNRWREGRVLVPRTNKPYQVNKNSFTFVDNLFFFFLKKGYMKSHSVLFFFLFKVVIEGLVESKRWGDIAVDDIKVLNGLSMTDCKGEAFSGHSYSASIHSFMTVTFISFHYWF